MKNKQSEELQSRREFFKKAAKAALPVVGAVVLSALPLQQAQATGCGWGDCTGNCYGGCDGTCGKNACTGGCQGNCAGGCSSSCYGSCSNTCNTRCVNTCISMSSQMGY